MTIEELLKKHQEIIDKWFKEWLEKFKKEVDKISVRYIYDVVHARLEGVRPPTVTCVTHRMVFED